MLPSTHDLTVYRGDDFVVTFDFTQGGVPLVLPATGWLAQVRKSTSDPAVLAAFTLDLSGAAVGRVIMSLTDTQTTALSSGVWDIENTDAGVTRSYVRGHLWVERDVTHA